MATMDVAKLCFRLGSILLVLIYCNCTKGARMPPMQKMGLTDQELDHDRVERSAISDNAMETARMARSAEMPPTMQMIETPTALAEPRVKRVKRDCGCCCGSGSSEERRRRRRRRRRRNRNLAAVHLFLGNSTFDPSVNGSVLPAPLIFVTNSSRVLPNGDEIDSEEVIIISPVSASGDDVSPSDSYSYEDSSENLLMPYIGTYSRRVPPGQMCMSNGDCVIGAVCKHVSGMGHCVCQPPLVNLGNACVPRSASGS